MALNSKTGAVDSFELSDAVLENCTPYVLSVRGTEYGVVSFGLEKRTAKAKIRKVSVYLPEIPMASWSASQWFTFQVCCDWRT